MALKKVKAIDGIPLHYARTQAHPYGSRGIPVTFRMEKKFHATLVTCIEELFAACPLGKPEVITSAGTFVNKPGAHGRGTAIDIDAIFWKDFTLVTRSYPTNTELYLGVESFLRRHFGIVLNYVYNAAHEDHWHVDNSVSVSFNKRSRSKVLYLQLTLKHLYGINVVIDGLFGPQTAGAYADATARLGLTDSLNKANWLRYLDYTGRVAFGFFARQTTPADLLDNIYALVEAQVPRSQTLTEAINTFRQHPDTVAWLADMESREDVLEEVIREVIS